MSFRNIIGLVLILGLSGLSACKSAYLFTSFNEPATDGLRLLTSTDALNWHDCNHIFLKPEVGNQHVMRDPSMAVGDDGVFHLVWTSSWRGDLGFGYASSPDLIHWSQQQLINVMAHDTSTVNVWAPEVFYDDAEKRFIIVWSSTIPYKFPKGVEEEKNNHRLYYTITTDFKTFTPAKLFFDPGYSCIDATIVKRGAKDYVLVFKDNTRPNRNLKVAFSDSPLGPWTSISEPFTPADWGYCEGPNVVKRGKSYYIYFDAYTQKKYGAVETRDFKTFKLVNSIVHLPEGHKHGTILKVKPSVLKQLERLTVADNSLNK